MQIYVNGTDTQNSFKANNSRTILESALSYTEEKEEVQYYNDKSKSMDREGQQGRAET